MPINIPDIVGERGKADARRHREKQRAAIKKRLPEIISEESIITQKGKGKTVKVPIKSIQIPIFRHGANKEESGGMGQGKEKKGAPVGRSPAPGSNKPGTAGNEPGVDYIETEIEIEELVEMMLEDLGLPRLHEKDVREIIVELGFRLHGTQHTGPHVLLNKRKTAKEGLRRFWHMLRALEKESGKDEFECYKALKESGGIYAEALSLLQSGSITVSDEEKAAGITPFPLLHSNDLRYHKIEQNTAMHSRAVVFALRDISYSMDTEKTYFSRSMLYWLVEFLRRLYEHVEVRFIVHNVTARLADEEEFFSAGESGGTLCASAYKLANNMLDSEYPMSQWNSYVWHFTDGDDWAEEKSVSEVRALFERKINMFGYCEIRPGDSFTSSPSDLLRAFRSAFPIKEKFEKSVAINASNNEAYPFLGIRLFDKEGILPAIQAFLKQDRWTEEV